MSLIPSLSTWFAAEKRAFAGLRDGAPIWFRLAGSKIVTALGAIMAVASAVCLSNADAVAALAPKHGPKACLAVAIIGTVLTSLGRSLTDRSPEARAAAEAKKTAEHPLPPPPGP